MKCKKCGFDTPNNSNYCSHCGEPIDFTDEFISDDYNSNNESDTYFKNQSNRYREEDLRTSSGEASIGWLFLGFFCPIAGFIIYYIYAYRKPSIAQKCRVGAFYGMILYIITIVVNIIVSMM